MVRTKKIKAEEVDVEYLAFLVRDAYGELCQEHDSSDFSGHDYAYRCGYVKSALEKMMRELGIN